MSTSLLLGLTSGPVFYGCLLMCTFFIKREFYNYAICKLNFLFLFVVKDLWPGNCVMDT